MFCYLSLSSAAHLSQYNSLTHAQCDSIISKLQASLQMVDCSVIVQHLYNDRILTPDEFGKLQDRSFSGRHRCLLTALRRTGKLGLKSFHHALERTAAQHRDVLFMLVAKGVCVCVCVCVCTSTLLTTKEDMGVSSTYTHLLVCYQCADQCLH